MGGALDRGEILPRGRRCGRGWLTRHDRRRPPPRFHESGASRALTLILSHRAFRERPCRRRDDAHPIDQARRQGVAHRVAVDDQHLGLGHEHEYARVLTGAVPAEKLRLSVRPLPLNRDAGKCVHLPVGDNLEPCADPRSTHVRIHVPLRRGWRRARLRRRRMRRGVQGACHHRENSQPACRVHERPSVLGGGAVARRGSDEAAVRAAEPTCRQSRKLKANITPQTYFPAVPWSTSSRISIPP